MPFLAVASAGASVAKNLGVSFQTPSEKRARKVIPSIVAAANKGNMQAVAILDTRRTVGISKEQAEWRNGFSQVNPQILAAYNKNRARYVDAIPATAQANPEAAASYALSTSVGLPALDLALAPINDLADAAKETGAQIAERVGVGGGAALARETRGTKGPLDRVIAFSQKPGGTVMLVVAGVVLIAGLAFLAGRR